MTYSLIISDSLGIGAGTEDHASYEAAHAAALRYVADLGPDSTVIIVDPDNNYEDISPLPR